MVIGKDEDLLDQDSIDAMVAQLTAGVASAKTPFALSTKPVQPSSKKCAPQYEGPCTTKFVVQPRYELAFCPFCKTYVTVPINPMGVSANMPPHKNGCVGSGKKGTPVSAVSGPCSRMLESLNSPLVLK